VSLFILDLEGEIAKNYSILLITKTYIFVK